MALGGIGGQPKMPSVIGLFKRDSIGSTSGSRRGSLQSLHHARIDSPRHSIGSEASIASGGFDMRMGAMGGVDRGDMESGGPPPVSSGMVPRRGSTFLATPILEVAEETETAEGSRSSSSQSNPVKSTGAATHGGAEGGSDTSETVQPGASSPPSSTSSSPAHSKPTSPSHVSSKTPLDVIDEGDGPGGLADPQDLEPHTKL